MGKSMGVQNQNPLDTYIYSFLMLQYIICKQAGCGQQFLNKYFGQLL
jgi:hypothetical protein